MAGCVCHVHTLCQGKLIISASTYLHGSHLMWCFLPTRRPHPNLPLPAPSCSCRWAHKSFVDPNFVAAYSIHEGGLLLPGGGSDSQRGVPLECALGLHLVNMMSPRMYGTGEELQLNGTRFDLTAYVQALSEERRKGLRV